MSILNSRSNGIYYDFVGSGSNETVCFLHAIATDGGMWSDQVAPLLANGFSVLRLDLRGHGGSGAVDGPYTVDDLRLDVLAVLDANEIARCHFVGLSIGGIIAIGLALHDPGRVISLTVCNALPGSIAAAAPAWQQRIAAVTAAGSVAPLAQGMLDRWITPSARQRDSGVCRRLLDGIRATSVEGFIGCAALMKDFDFVADLPDLKLPLLVVGGSDDSASPPSETKRIASLVPDANYIELAGTRHFANLEDPDVFNEMLVTWCKKNRRDRALHD